MYKNLVNGCIIICIILMIALFKQQTTLKNANKILGHDIIKKYNI